MSFDLNYMAREMKKSASTKVGSSVTWQKLAASAWQASVATKLPSTRRASRLCVVSLMHSSAQQTTSGRRVRKEARMSDKEWKFGFIVGVICGWLFSMASIVITKVLH